MIASSLRAVRDHLGMEVAFVGRFDDGRRVFEFVDAVDTFCPIREGDSDPRDGSYCDLVVTGRIPELIPDTSQVPEVAGMAVTHQLPVGSHISVPLRGADGEPFGTFCCFSREPDPNLRARDLEVLRVLGDVVAEHLHFLLGRREAHDEAFAQISQILASGGPSIALQPIFDLREHRVAGYEALSRFPVAIDWPADRWFELAHEVGLGVDLEVAAVRAALRLLPQLPADVDLAVNVSAYALTASDEVVDLIAAAEPRRTILEVTEHDRLVVDDAVTTRLASLRRLGVRVAADDAGSGYAGLEHVLELGPEVLKLDRALVQGVGSDAARQAMVDAMARFASRTGATLVAEGVETEQDLETLRFLGVKHAQGYLLGRPEVWGCGDESADIPTVSAGHD